jgi:hypothetical protein
MNTLSNGILRCAFELGELGIHVTHPAEENDVVSAYHAGRHFAKYLVYGEQEDLNLYNAHMALIRKRAKNV